MRIFDKTDRIPGPQRIIAVLWLSFLTAGMATGAFFSAIDPMELQYCVSFPYVSRSWAYTIGFFLFWLLTAGTGLLVVYFIYPADAEDS